MKRKTKDKLFVIIAAVTGAAIGISLALAGGFSVLYLLSYRFGG